MTTWTVVTVVRRGEFSILGIIDGSYGVGWPTTVDDDAELATHLIEADTREQAEAYVRQKYFPQPEEPQEEVPC